MKLFFVSTEVILNYDLCVICQKNSNETLQIVTRENYPILKEACTLKSNLHSISLSKELENEDSFFSNHPLLHPQCRRNFTRIAYKKRTREASPNDSEISSLRSKSKRESNNVDPNICLLCGKERDNKGNQKLIPITTFNRQNVIWKKAKEVGNTLLLNKIEGFGNSCVDMIALELKYHNSCMTTFLNTKSKNDNPFGTSQVAREE